MKIYLVRHGLTKSNTHGLLYYGDEPLSQEGIDDLLRKKVIYEDLDISYSYCSPLLRAKMTFEILFPNLIVNEYRNDIVEFDINDEASNDQDKKAIKEKAIKSLNETGTIDKVGDGESFEQFMQRIDSFMHEIINQHQDDENILVVSHGLAISAMVMVLFETDSVIFDLIPPNGLGYLIDTNTHKCKKIFFNQKDEEPIIADIKTQENNEEESYNLFIQGRYIDLKKK